MADTRPANKEPAIPKTAEKNELGAFTMAVCNYLIVGAGQAGCRAALTIREADQSGNIVLVGAETHPPYERPALSKSVLKGTVEPDSVIIKHPAQFQDLNIQTVFGHSIDTIDVAARAATLDNGLHLPFDKLLLATGSQVRQLSVPGTDLPNIHTLRTIDDALALSNNLKSCRNLVVVGAGFIGLEVAASAREKFGCNVTIVEVGSGVLQRGAPECLRSIIHDLHCSEGVKFLFGTGVDGFEGTERVKNVMLSSGEKLPADCVVVGIGISPETGLAERAGVAVNDGILVNEYGETSIPGIFAAGEVTRHKNLFSDEIARRESWQIAQNQSVAAANAMCGLRVGYTDIPWFWTDQFSHNFQFIGDSGLNLEPVTRTYDGDLKSTIFFLRNDLIAGAVCINSGRDIRLVRDAIQKGVKISREHLVDPTVNLKKHLNRATAKA